MDGQDFGRFWRSQAIDGAQVKNVGDVTAIFSFRTVKERRRLVEMVKQGVLSRFEGGTGQGVIIHGQMA